ncbi:hypothetical protein AcW1_009241 [Taiwanofungus camphoratus]|nr:hypothetical protein AcW1_009241 [Antrodia cinnamomea]
MPHTVCLEPVLFAKPPDTPDTEDRLVNHRCSTYIRLSAAGGRSCPQLAAGCARDADRSGWDTVPSVRARCLRSRPYLSSEETPAQRAVDVRPSVPALAPPLL